MSGPVVLKVDWSWGGLGVRVVGSRDEAERAFSEFVTLPSWPETATQAKKMERQPNVSTRKPPTLGPMAGASTTPKPNMDNALP